MENWRMLEEYPGYEISDLGRCRSPSGLILKPIRRRKYFAYHLPNKVGEPKKHLIHRLVLTAFVGPCPPEQETRHLNGDHSNNRLSNLKWGTHPENIEDSERLGETRRGSNHGMAKLSEKDVRDIRALPQPFTKALRQELTKRYGIAVVTLYRIKNEENWLHLS